MEIETAARKLLLAHPEINGYVSQKIYKFTLEEHVDGTGGSAIVVRRGSGWASSDTVKTSEFPTLYVDCWSDASREDGEIVVDNAVDRALAIARSVDRFLHGQRDEMWGQTSPGTGLRVITCHRWNDVYFATAKDVHGQGDLPDTPRGNSAVATIQFALQVAH
ncbi:tail terminator [Arthrobacter phage Kitkat]|uniref:Tail terminator n=3 Tax=Kelleziovirus TaxID=1982236 RepID=A0A140G6B2_9CAUD|nr:tail terminator [Arthrobacter phage KellEzio]YP_009303311.1 tail terminator [Arthrobacter phage Kitkat]AMM44197.1 tail terminator [Arthrobacter phage KellEzio]AMM44290.1 tail terminator [Arthrobacter phage Kitkat]QGJ96466.1 tail terminator [Arthrobacter phage BeatusComedenti]